MFFIVMMNLLFAVVVVVDKTCRFLPSYETVMEGSGGNYSLTSNTSNRPITKANLALVIKLSRQLATVRIQ